MLRFTSFGHSVGAALTESCGAKNPGMDLGCELEEGAGWPLPPQPCGVLVSSGNLRKRTRCEIGNCGAFVLAAEVVSPCGILPQPT